MKDFKTKNGFFTGNVGIGTTNPERKLEISADNNGDTKSNYIRITDTDTTATLGAHNGGIEFYSKDSSGQPGLSAAIESIYAGSGGGGEISLSTSANSGADLVEAMRIDNSGNVGIGTSSPSEKLHVAGDIIVQTSAGASGGVIHFGSESDKTKIVGRDSTASNAPNTIDFMNTSDTGSTVRMRIDSAGNVGIGTTSPNFNLSIVDSSDAIIQLKGNSLGRVYFGDTADDNVGRIQYYHVDNSMQFWTGDTEKMRIDSAGNVGIGTANPVAKLQIAGDSTNLGGIILGHALGTGIDSFRFYIDSENRAHITRGTSERITILNTGNVGIGTSNPSGALDIEGPAGSDTYLFIANSPQQAGNAHNAVIEFIPTGRNTTNHFFGKCWIKALGSNSANGGTMTFSTRDTLNVEKERVRITSAGYVGIGTTSPLDELHIFNDTTAPRIKIQCANSSNAALLFGDVDDDTEAGILWDAGTQKLHIRGYNNTNRITIDDNGNVGVGVTDPGSYKLYVNGNAFSSGTWGTSDDRVKHNEQPIVGALETISKITPKKYIKTVEMYESDHDFELDADGNPIDENGKPVDHHIEAGVIAQQVLTVDELAFAVSPEGVDEDGKVTSPHGLDYNSLFTYAIAAIQEQQTIIEDLKSQNESLIARIEALEG